MEGHHSSIWDHKYSWKDRCLRVMYAGPCACQARIGPPAFHFHCTDSHLWGVTTRFLLSANLSEEPEFPPHCNPCQSGCWKGFPSQLGTTGGSPDGTLRRICLWPLERLDPGGVEPPRSRGVAKGGARSGQGAAGQMGTPVCPQQPETKGRHP